MSRGEWDVIDAAIRVCRHFTVRGTMTINFDGEDQEIPCDVIEGPDCVRALHRALDDFLSPGAIAASPQHGDLDPQ